MFLSDNGMAFPFAKTNCYLNSTRTPFLARWPAVIQAGRVDTEHFISGVDYLPTVLDAIGVDIPDGVNGKSRLPVLRGEKQDGCEQVYSRNFTRPRGGAITRCDACKTRDSAISSTPGLMASENFEMNPRMVGPGKR